MGGVLDAPAVLQLSALDKEPTETAGMDNTDLQWRSAGAVEVAAMGFLAQLPVAGVPAAITADTLVLQAMRSPDYFI